MLPSDFAALEPFGETCAKSFDCSNRMVKFGYRAVGTDVVLSSIEVPLTIVHQSVSQEILIWLNINGTVTVGLECSSSSVGFKEISLGELVHQLLQPHRLFMEEIGPSDLGVLLQQLEVSVGMIKDRMAGQSVGLQYRG